MSYLETLACCVCVFLIYLFVVPEWSRRRFGERLAGPVGLVVAEGARWITPARPPLQPLHTTTTTTTSSTTKPLFAQFRAPNLSAEAVRSCALWCYSVQWGRGGGVVRGQTENSNYVSRRILGMGAIPNIQGIPDAFCRCTPPYYQTVTIRKTLPPCYTI